MHLSDVCYSNESRLLQIQKHVSLFGRHIVFLFLPGSRLLTGIYTPTKMRVTGS